MTCQDHPTTTVTFPDGFELPVDADIAGLSESMSDRQWGVFPSCQDCDGRVMLTFMFTRDLEEFLSIVADDTTPSGQALGRHVLKDPLSSRKRDQDPSESELSWNYEVATVLDVSHGPAGERRGCADVRIATRVLFPRQHLELVEARLTG